FRCSRLPYCSFPLQTSYCRRGMSGFNRLIGLFSTTVAASPHPHIAPPSSFFDVALEHVRSLEMIYIRG
ncbi:hypothetical protein PFISCL1PPCAC_24681, partial [Pristionchus fissidentatus]